MLFARSDPRGVAVTSLASFIHKNRGGGGVGCHSQKSTRVEINIPRNRGGVFTLYTSHCKPPVYICSLSHKNLSILVMVDPG